MGTGITLDNAAIMSTVLEGILYGFSLLMFIGTIWVLVQDEGYTASNRTRITIAVILLVLSTVHMIVDIVRIDEGLVKYRDTFPGGPVAFFEDVAQNTFVIKNAIYTLQTLLGDGVVIYRCYVVWNSTWVVVLPVMLWCSVAATGVGAVYSVSQATTNASNIFARETGQWITAFYASTLSTNLLSSGILAYRIWTVERNTASIRTSRNTLIPLIRVLVDAAALYSAALFTALICFVNSNNGQYVVLDMIMPIISIAFYMVLIRIGMRRKKLNYISNTRSGSRNTSAESQDTPHGMRPLQVHISRFSRKDATPPYGETIDQHQEFGRDQSFSTDKMRPEGVYQV